MCESKMKKCSFLFIISVTMAAKLPDEIQLCSRSDPNINTCMKNGFAFAFKKFLGGYKPLGIAGFEPLPIAELSFVGSGGITQIYQDIKIFGLSKCSILDMQLDLDGLRMDIKLLCPRTEMKANYQLKGKLIAFPLDSSGKCSIVLADIHVDHKTKLERFEKAGKKYIRVKDWKMKINPSKVHFYYENVMPGNKELSENILKTMNENSIQIFSDQAGGFEEGYAVIHKAIANKVFEKFPEDELFLP